MSNSRSNSVKLDVSHFQKGIYVVVIETQTGIAAVKKLLVE